MSTLELAEAEPLAVERENVIQLPAGLLGFEHIKRYVLLTNADEAPFSWLQGIDDPSLAFLMVPPFEVAPDYAPELSDEDVIYLGLKSSFDALMYNVVTLRGGTATVNLKGPVVINRYTLRGKQVVLQNAAKFSVKHPLPLASANEF